MGHHYVPQRYLRNFEATEESGRVWQYGKKDGKARSLPIKIVAQSRDFYAPEMETYLANVVEPSGSEAIDKLLQGRSISRDERLDLALYLAVAMKRVPTHRDRSWSLVPDVLSEVMANFRESVQEAAGVIDLNTLSDLLRQADRIEKEYELEPPRSVEDQIRDPMPSPGVLGAIITMDWRLCESDGPQWFITSDNPFFFTSGIGLGGPHSEFFLPLSPTHLLHGSRKKPTSGIPRCKMRQSVVKQVNNLTVLEAANFVFAHGEFPWLPSVLANIGHRSYRPAWEPKDR